MDVNQYRDIMRRNPVWLAIRREAKRDAASEPILSSFLWASILSHDDFDRSLAFVLANRLSDATMMPTELFDLFYSVLKANPKIVSASLQDCQAAMERDPACHGYSQALLFFKGYHALQVRRLQRNNAGRLMEARNATRASCGGGIAHLSLGADHQTGMCRNQAQRVAHVLWNGGRQVMALALQSRVSDSRLALGCCPLPLFQRPSLFPGLLLRPSCLLPFPPLFSPIAAVRDGVCPCRSAKPSPWTSILQRRLASGFSSTTAQGLSSERPPWWGTTAPSCRA